MEKNSGLHLLYKKLGETPNQCLMRFKRANPQFFDIPMTYAGRLDPVAEGLLLILSENEIVEKQRYMDMQKTYEFEILWGFSTDTQDVLGMASIKEISIPTTVEVKKSLETSSGKFEQQYPAFSSKPVDGKPLFLWAREGKLKEIEIPNHEVEIIEIGHISRKTIKGSELLNDIKTKVQLVVGDFRQKEILNKWMELLITVPDKEFTIDKVSITASGGFYVRQFVSDFAKSFDAVATTFHIKRTKVGEYSVENAI